MCCDKSLQVKVRLIGMGTLSGAFMTIVFVQSMLVFCSYKINESKTFKCTIKLDHQHEYSHTGPISAITVFLVLLDIPASVVLLIGASLHMKYNLVPWLALNGIKMILIVILFSVITWCTYVNLTGVVPKYDLLDGWKLRTKSKSNTR